MKIADLFNEHKMKLWFKGSAILFGVLWGGFGVLLLSSNNIIANIVLAMVIAFILRFRIDYLNHGIGASVILITFLHKSSFDIDIFFPFFLAFALFGFTEDYISEKVKKKIAIPKRIPFYSLTTLIYSIISGFWIIFFAFLVYELFYILTDIYGMKVIQKQTEKT